MVGDIEENKGVINLCGLIGSPLRKKGYAASWMRAAVQSRRRIEAVSHDPHKELRDYTESPLETSVGDPVRWWGYHQTQYPTLARMARDYLAIQGSSVPSERAFSSGALTGTLRRNRLLPESFEALQILKGAYKSGVVNANGEAKAHEPREWEWDSSM